MTKEGSVCKGIDLLKWVLQCVRVGWDTKLNWVHGICQVFH